MEQPTVMAANASGASRGVPAGVVVQGSILAAVRLAEREVI
jgi:hypothetical protein